MRMSEHADDRTKQGRLTDDERQSAMHRTRLQRDETLAAVHELEAALAAPAPSRETAWGQVVLEALGKLESALKRQLASPEDHDHLWTDIQQISPRLERRIARLRWQLDDLCRQISSMRVQLADALAETPDYADFRRRLALTLAALRHFRDQEADLIYECY